jgi:hypothetical protein
VFDGTMSAAMLQERCPGCGAVLAAREGQPHVYMTGSPACWAAYGELLAAQYNDPERMRFHQLVVDTYAVQHPGGHDPRAVRSVGIHLMTLCLFLEDGTDPALGTRLHRRMVARPVFHRLTPPEQRGRLTCLDVPTSGPAPQARSRVYAWAEDVWAAWAVHHDTVRGWLIVSGLASDSKAD